MFPELQAQNAAFFGLRMPGAYWCDIGTPGEYRRATADALAGRVALRGARARGIAPDAVLGDDVHIDGDVWIGAGAILGNRVRIVGPSVVGDDVRIGDDVRMDRSIVWDEARIGERVSGSATRSWERDTTCRLRRPLTGRSWRTSRPLCLACLAQRARRRGLPNERFKMVRALRAGTMDTAHASALVRLAAETRWPREAHLSAILRETLATTGASCASFERNDGDRIALDATALAEELRAAVLAEHAQFARRAIAGCTIVVGEAAWPGRTVLSIPIETKDGWCALALSGDVDLRDEAVSFGRVATDVMARVLEREPLQAADTLYRDPLTRLPNRDATFGRLEEALYSAARHDARVAVFYVDLDGFKGINDQYGHAVGDVTLIEVARRMQATLRRDELIGRLGGDEFAAVLPNVSSVDEVLTAAERLGNRLAEPIDVDDLPFCISATIGIALFPDDGDWAQPLLGNADAAMYQAKREGRDSIRLFGENVATELRIRRDLRDRLRSASIERDFLLCFQPVIASCTAVRRGRGARALDPSVTRLALAAFVLRDGRDDAALVAARLLGRRQRAALDAAWLEAGLDPPVNVNVTAPESGDRR